MFFFWIVTAIGIYSAIYVTFSLCELTICNQHFFLTSQTADNFYFNTNLIFNFFLPPSRFGKLASISTRLAILIYVGLLLGIIFIAVQKKGKRYLKDFGMVKRYHLGNAIKNLAIYHLCKNVASENGVKAPTIVIIPSKIPHMSSKYIGFPYFKSFLLISEGSLQLTSEELEGLIAHEIFHIKNHCFSWYLLNIMSDYTLFGTGFLAVLTNSYSKELAADEFAVKMDFKEKDNSGKLYQCAENNGSFLCNIYQFRFARFSGNKPNGKHQYATKKSKDILAKTKKRF